MDKFFDKLRQLQQKPQHVRQRILVITTATLGTLIFLFWLSIFPSTISEVRDRATARAKSAPSPFASLLAPLSDVGKSLSTAGKNVISEARYIRKQASSTALGTSTPAFAEQNASTSLATSSPNEASE